MKQSMSYEELRLLCHKVFQAAGFTQEEVECCADELLDAEWRGRKSHGIAIVEEVITWRKAKEGEPEIINEKACSAFIEGGNGLGPLVAKMAMDLAVKKAECCGLGIVGVRNRSPFILAGYHPRRAARQGLIAADWSVAVSRVAPYGCIHPVFGTNPIGIAIPARGESVVLDMAVTEMAAAEIRMAKRMGEAIPQGVAIDKEGNPTTDPAAAIEGAMLTFGGYKGSGLAMIIELLGGAWVGSKTGTSHPGERGMVFFAAQTDLFGQGSNFVERVESLCDDIRLSVRAGDPLPHIPGKSPISYSNPTEVDQDAIEHLIELAEKGGSGGAET